jgi:eukaryotic-like serine/threonine-protein kinase
MQLEVLGERYQLQDPIGRGGMATIYRGRDMRMDRPVAIKVLREVYSTDPKFVTRFQREAKAASALQHPNIVQVYDYGQSDGNYFIVMELIDGTDLRRYLRSRGILPVERAIIIAHDVALGLGAAHRRGIVHRDVKPQNVLVGRNGSIKLTDFGIASVYKDINDERLTTTGMTLGTVQYYAPEQAQGEIVSPAADVYALGIVMYEMLTGRTPFDGDTPVAVAMQHIQDLPTPPSHLNAAIPSALEGVILRCLEKVPEMRYRDGSVLARALEELGEDALGATLARGITPDGVVTPPASGAAIPRRPGSTSRPAAATNNNYGDANFYAPSGALNSDEPTLRADQAPIGAARGASAVASPGMAQNYAPYNASSAMPPGTAATRPYDKGTLSGRSAQGDSRFASAITILILLATLLLLAFSVFLVWQMHLLPFLKGPSTPAAQVAVPNLVGDTLQQAQTTATKAGNFKIQVDHGQQDGIVSDQTPNFGAKAAPGSTIHVDMKNRSTTITVPDVTGKTVADAEAILTQQGIMYVVQSDPLDANDPTKENNIVTRTDPRAGATLQNANQTVTIYVTNFTQNNQGQQPPPGQTTPTAPPATPTAPPATPTAPPATPTAPPTTPTPDPLPGVPKIP